MEFGWYVEFHRQVPQQSDTDAFAQGLAQVEDAERCGLDAIWLAEIHQQANRSVLSVPMTVASAIAARTSRIRIGTAVQVLPLCHPLRLAEESAHGRSDQPRPAADGRRTQRQPARLCRLRRAVFGKPRALLRNAGHSQAGVDAAELFVSKASIHSFNDARAVPRPYQQPHPPIRIAGASEDTFPVLGKLGYPLFVAVRSGSLARPGAGSEGLSRGVQGGRPSRQRRRASAPDAACRRDRRPGARASRTQYHAGLSAS